MGELGSSVFKHFFNLTAKTIYLNYVIKKSKTIDIEQIEGQKKLLIIYKLS